MRFGRTLIGLVASIAVVSAACSTALAPAPDDALAAADRAAADGAAAGACDARVTATIDPRRVAIDDVAWRVPAADDIGADDRRRLLGELGDALAARIAELPAAPHGRPAIVRAAITQVDTVSPGLNALSALVLIVPLDRGGASVDIEAVDAETGSRLAALRVRRVAPLTEVKAHFNRLAPAELAVRDAAAAFAALLRDSNARQASR